MRPRYESTTTLPDEDEEAEEAEEAEAEAAMEQP